MERTSGRDTPHPLLGSGSITLIRLIGSPWLMLENSGFGRMATRTLIVPSPGSHIVILNEY